jgi:hypothetical protein
MFWFDESVDEFYLNHFPVISHYQDCQNVQPYLDDRPHSMVFKPLLLDNPAGVKE